MGNGKSVSKKCIHMAYDDYMLACCMDHRFQMTFYIFCCCFGYNSYTSVCTAWLQRTWLNITVSTHHWSQHHGGLRSATTSNLVIARCRLSTYGTRAFSVAGPVCWNSLPDYLKSSDLSFSCFRQQLKHFYIVNIDTGPSTTLAH